MSTVSNLFLIKVKESLRNFKKSKDGWSKKFNILSTYFVSDHLTYNDNLGVNLRSQ